MKERECISIWNTNIIYYQHIGEGENNFARFVLN